MPKKIPDNHKTQNAKDRASPDDTINKKRWNNSNPCSPCKKCCQISYIKIEDADILRWKKEQRYDIILCLEEWTSGSIFLIHKKDKDECIFLTDNGCSIHNTRPEVCKRFPLSANHARQLGCKLANIMEKANKTNDKNKENSTAIP